MGYGESLANPVVLVPVVRGVRVEVAVGVMGEDVVRV